MKKFFLFFTFFTITVLVSQESSDRITDARVPLMVLASDNGNDPNSIQSQVTRIVADEAVKLKRFTVVDRTNLEAILAEQALQMSGVVSDSDLVAFGEISAAREALLVEILTFGQKGVKPEEDKEEDREDRKTARKAGILGVLAKTIVDAAVSDKKEKEEAYSDNIQTTVQARVSKIDLQTGTSITSFTLTASHTGGAKSRSLAVTLKKIALKASFELRSMYLLVTEVLEASPMHVLLYLGDDVGVKPGTLFRISSPRTKRTIRDRTINVPGKPVAIVRSTSITEDANQAKILRRWDQISPGYEAEEIPRSIFSWGMRGRYGVDMPEVGFELQAYWKSFSRIGGGLTFGLGTVQDSRGDTDFSFGFGGDFYFRLINRPAFSLMGTLSLPGNVVTRSDDEDHSAFSFIFSPRIGGRIDLMTSSRRDIFFQVEYVLGSSQSPWNYSEGEDSKSFIAEWTGSHPEIKPQGLYFSIGMRFISFSLLGGPQLNPGVHLFP